MRWVKLAGLALLAEVALIAAAIFAVFVYSVAIHPGQAPAFYEAQASVIAPWVAVAVSFPLFYWMSRWAFSPLALWAVHVVIDVALSMSTDGVNGITAILPFWLTSQALKLLGCWLGGRRNLQH